MGEDGEPETGSVSQVSSEEAEPSSATGGSDEETGDADRADDDPDAPDDEPSDERDGPEPDEDGDATSGDSPPETDGSDADAAADVGLEPGAAVTEPPAKSVHKGGPGGEGGHPADEPTAEAANYDTGTADPVEQEGPPEDAEMPLAEHIEEMIKRLAIVIVVAGSVSIVVFPLADVIINFLWYSFLPASEPPRVYGPLEFLLAQIKVASLAGLLVALPVLVYQTYRFMRPGLYRQERRYYLAAVPTSLVLAIVGVVFAYFVILPAIFTYFLAYSQPAGEIAFALARTFDLMLILIAYLALVFQIPLVIMLAIMMGITTREWLQNKRLYFWGAFLGVAFISSPDPTGMAPILIALTMGTLYEGTLLILQWVGR